MPCYENTSGLHCSWELQAREISQRVDMNTLALLRQNTLSIWMNWRVNALFAWFIVHLDFLSRKEFLRTRHVRVFFFGHLPLPKCVGRSKANDRCRRVLEYSLTGRHFRDMLLNYIWRSACISCRDFKSDGSTSKKTNRSMLQAPLGIYERSHLWLLRPTDLR